MIFIVSGVESAVDFAHHEGCDSFDSPTLIHLEVNCFLNCLLLFCWTVLAPRLKTKAREPPLAPGASFRF